MRAKRATFMYNIEWSCQKCQKSSTLRAFENLKLGVKQCYQIDIRTRCKGHGVFLLAFGPSGFRRYLIKSRAITVRKIPPAKNICKMSGGRYPMHIKLPYNQPTELAYYTTQKILMTAWKYFWQHRCEKNDKKIHQELLPKSKVFECHFWGVLG